MHEKRLTAPKTWKIKRKELAWTTPLSPGPHSKEQALPLIVLIRDVLGLARNKKEVKALLDQGEIKIDGKVRKKLDFPVGVLDSVSIGDNDYRVVISRGKIQGIPVDDVSKKIVKIEKKKKEGDKFQYGFHDGKTIISEEEFLKGNSLLLKLPEKEVSKEIPLEEGVKTFVYKGSHKGKIAEVLNIRKMGVEKDKVVLKHNGDQFETLLKYVIAVGKKEPLVKLESDKE